MSNMKMRTLELTRADICKIMTAITAVKCDFMKELRSEDISEDRRKIAESSLDMWKELHEKVKSQLEEQDSK